MGVYLPYFNLYCYHLGLSAFQIGSLSALRSVVMVLFPLFWGILADRFQARRPIYIGCNIVSTFVWVLFLYFQEFRALLALTAAYGIFYAPLISFLEAFTMDALQEEKSGYGRIRAWGSIAFIVTVILVGRLIEMFSIGIILSLVLFGSALQALLSIKIPRASRPGSVSFFGQAATLLNRRALLFLSGAFLMLLSHGAYYGFFSIHLENLGFNSGFIGFAWALASIAEIAVMLASVNLLKRYAHDKILMFSCLVAAVRWFSLYFIESSWAILLSQLLHAVTYGTFHMASILYIDTLTPGPAKTVGQAVNNAVSYGLGLMAGFFFSGILYGTVGAFNMFALSGLTALLAALAMAALIGWNSGGRGSRLLGVERR